MTRCCLVVTSPARIAASLPYECARAQLNKRERQREKVSALVVLLNYARRECTQRAETIQQYDE